MQAYICTTCGIQYAPSEKPPAHCTICEDDRQYVNREGQQWTTLEALQADHHNVFSPIEPNLTRIQTQPKFAIGQSGYLIHTDEGNILWECNSLIDEATVASIQERGGLNAIAISHPHFYDAMIEWSHAFGGIPIYLHEANREWVMRPDNVIDYWSGETFVLTSGLTIIRCGGHFEGSSVLHWQQGANGAGVLLTGDTIMVTADRHVSFMYSYPNYIPMNEASVQRIVSAVTTFEYDRLYSSWQDAVIETGAKKVVNFSAERYISHIR